MHYRWHPLFGCDVAVHLRVGRPAGVAFRCQVGEDDKRNRLEFPAWMFDRAVCSQMQSSRKPHATVRALSDLKSLLNEAAPRPGGQDPPPFVHGGADAKETTTVQHAASTGSVRPTGPRAAVGRACTRHPDDSDDVDCADVAGALGARRRAPSEGGRL